MTTDTGLRGIRNRLMLSMGVSVVVAVAMTGLMFAIVAGTIGTVVTDTQVVERIEAADETLAVSILTQETFAFDYALSHSERPLEELADAEEEAELAYAELHAVLPAGSPIAAAVDQVEERAAAWRSEWLDPFIASVGSGETIDGESAVASNEEFFGPLEEALEDLEAKTAALRASTRAELSATVERLALAVIPLGLAATILLAIMGSWLTRTISGPLRRLNRTAEQVVAGEDVRFNVERRDEIGALASVLETLRSEAAARYETARREAVRAATFNQLAELTSFAQDEPALLNAAVLTLKRVAPTPRGHIMLVNNSTNRLVVAAAWGDDAPTTGAPIELDRIDRCPGIRRATAYVAADLSDEMTVHCPAHTATSGTVVCLPMPALGSIVGVIHLERTAAFGFEPETVQSAARIAEQVALAIANARLMKTMEGLAMTDPLTGLRNARFFDTYLEQELANAERDRESVALVMLDVDHFKVFNDTHGHPAGDEALRALSRVLRSGVRASDVVARYGGEEFVIALHHATLEEALIVADKIRTAVEQTVVEIGPGRYARMSISLGVAATDTHKADQKGLISLADAALYQAKETGRNRVAAAPTSDKDLSAAASRRAGRPARTRRERPVRLQAG